MYEICKLLIVRYIFSKTTLQRGRVLKKVRPLEFLGTQMFCKTWT